MVVICVTVGVAVDAFSASCSFSSFTCSVLEKVHLPLHNCKFIPEFIRCIGIPTGSSLCSQRSLHQSLILLFVGTGRVN